ncbi:cystine-binding periplasmic protein precursor [Oxobacter pfennigii]|uniref:Cystine-binding periplasmic protein n=1 Tax=Oxobacter pfennigii TaxID=36849 RepID=A0A0P8WST9_9CLOT|nr:transporter substrate-binding domain-containing protein [Oxobacter pfennigii]KPU45676.1 cystine-binding periplasmic protein precursor [Oxobacter pfennigii]
MKRVLAILLTVAMSFAVMAGCTNQNSGSGNQTEDIVASVKKSDAIAAALPDRVKTAGKIMIGVDDSYPPMEYRDDNNALVGFDVDFGNALGKKLGVEVEWVPTAWEGIIPSLQAAKFDFILSSLSITDERKLEIGFSEPYIQGGPVIITLKENTSIKSGDDLVGKVVGAQLGTTGEDAAKSVEGVKEIKSYDKITEALQDLSAKRTEAVVADDQVGRYYIALDPEKYIVAGKMVEEPFGIGFRKDDTALIDAVQKAIDELKSEGTLSKISMKWFNSDYYKN